MNTFNKNLQNSYKHYYDTFGTNSYEQLMITSKNNLNISKDISYTDFCAEWNKLEDAKFYHLENGIVPEDYYENFIKNNNLPEIWQCSCVNVTNQGILYFEEDYFNYSKNFIVPNDISEFCPKYDYKTFKKYDLKTFVKLYPWVKSCLEELQDFAFVYIVDMI